jgi:hypothetical protein
MTHIISSENTTDKRVPLRRKGGGCRKGRRTTITTVKITDKGYKYLLAYCKKDCNRI